MNKLMLFNIQLFAHKKGHRQPYTKVEIKKIK